MTDQFITSMHLALAIIASVTGLGVILALPGGQSPTGSGSAASEKSLALQLVTVVVTVSHSATASGSASLTRVAPWRR